MYGYIATLPVIPIIGFDIWPCIAIVIFQFTNTALLRIKYKLDVSIMMDEWPMMSCTLMRLPYCEVVSELVRSDHPCVHKQ